MMEDGIISGPPIPPELLEDPDEPVYLLVKKYANDFLNTHYMVRSEIFGCQFYARYRYTSTQFLQIDPQTDTKYAISQVIDESTALACELQTLGCKPGVMVGILSENRHEFAVILLAVLSTGATLACYNPMYSIGN